MADDWETAGDDVEEVAVADKWEGEDEGEGEGEDSWDADPQGKNKKATTEAAPLTTTRKPTQPVLSERKKKQLAEAEKKQKEKESEESENDPRLKAQRKLELEEQTRKRDAALAADLLGIDPSSFKPPVAAGDDGSDIAGGENTLTAQDKREIALAKGGQTLDDYKMDDDVSMEQLANNIIKKCIVIQSNAKHSARMLRFLKSLTNGICDVMKVDDVNELKRSITAKHNEVTIKQKAAQKGKKAANAVVGSKKANTVKVASTGGGSTGGRSNYGDELDDYAGAADDEDFM